MDLLAIILRILHIGSAIIAAGAIFFQFLALHPALLTLPETERAALRAQMLPRWRPVVFVCILLLLATGLLNFVLYKVPEYRGTPHAGLYHGLLGVKILAALAVFHAAAVLVMPTSTGERYRARAGFWLTYLVVLLALIVVIGALLSRFKDTVAVLT